MDGKAAGKLSFLLNIEYTVLVDSKWELLVSLLSSVDYLRSSGAYC